MDRMPFSRNPPKPDDVSAVRPYDANGNRRTAMAYTEGGSTTVTYYSYDAANELLTAHDSAGWTYFSYDANGNTVQEQTPSYTRYYDWDGRDMMTGVRSTEAGWTDNEIGYDGFASRASLLDSGGLTYYTWNGIRVLKTTAGDGTLKQRQVHGPSPSDIPSVGDIELIESAAGDAYTTEADQVGTIHKVLDSAATVANAYSYDAFGVARSATEAFANPYRFAGKPLDADSGLYHFIARQYGAALGRFSAVGQFLYWPRRFAYVSSRPTRVVDPLGLIPVGLPPYYPHLMVGDMGPDYYPHSDIQPHGPNPYPGLPPGVSPEISLPPGGPADDRYWPTLPPQPYPPLPPLPAGGGGNDILGFLGALCPVGCSQNLPKATWTGTEDIVPFSELAEAGKCLPSGLQSKFCRLMRKRWDDLMVAGADKSKDIRFVVYKVLCYGVSHLDHQQCETYRAWLAKGPPQARKAAISLQCPSV